MYDFFNYIYTVDPWHPRVQGFEETSFEEKPHMLRMGFSAVLQMLDSFSS
jgi:hypothetical protein